MASLTDSSKAELFAFLDIPRWSVHWVLDELPSEVARVFAKLVLHNSYLFSETGSWSKHGVSREGRLCQSCLVYDSDVHFLSTCCKYSVLRCKYAPFLVNMADADIYTLLNSNDKCQLTKVLNFCRRSVDEQKHWYKLDILANTVNGVFTGVTQRSTGSSTVQSPGDSWSD